MIIGIVGDVREAGLETPPLLMFYADYLQRPVYSQRMDVVLAGTGNPALMAKTAQATVRTLRPDVPPRVRTMDAIVASSVAGRRLALFLVGAFGAAALILSACGLYGVISFLVAQRGQELSLRIALGARRHDIVGLVLREGGALTAAGVIIGGATALAVTRMLAGLFYGVGAGDPVTFIGMIVLVSIVALAASWIPASRAARVEAARALRA